LPRTELTYLEIGIFYLRLRVKAGFYQLSIYRRGRGAGGATKTHDRVLHPACFAVRGISFYTK
jgi:hypothetical protein